MSVGAATHQGAPTVGREKEASEAILLWKIEQAIAESGFRWERYDGFVKVVLKPSDEHIRFCEVIDIGPELRTLGSGQTFHVAFMTAMVLNEIPVSEPEKEERCRAA